MNKLLGIVAGLCLMLVEGCYSGYLGHTVIDMSYESTGEQSINYVDENWDNVLVINSSEMGVWVQVSPDRWVLRHRSMQYENSQWHFGEWFDDNSIPYGCHCYGFHSQYCPIHGVRFHDYMEQNYSSWHKDNFSRVSGRWNSNRNHQESTAAAQKPIAPLHLSSENRSHQVTPPAIVQKQILPNTEIRRKESLLQERSILAPKPSVSLENPIRTATPPALSVLQNSQQKRIEPVLMERKDGSNRIYDQPKGTFAEGIQRTMLSQIAQLKRSKQMRKEDEKNIDRPEESHHSSPDIEIMKTQPSLPEPSSLPQRSEIQRAFRRK